MLTCSAAASALAFLDQIESLRNNPCWYVLLTRAQQPIGPSSAFTASSNWEPDSRTGIVGTRPLVARELNACCVSSLPGEAASQQPLLLVEASAEVSMSQQPCIAKLLRHQLVEINKISWQRKRAQIAFKPDLRGLEKPKSLVFGRYILPMYLNLIEIFFLDHRMSDSRCNTRYLSIRPTSWKPLAQVCVNKQHFC